MSPRLTALLVVLLAAFCAAPPADALTIGIADQKPDMFSDLRFLSSDLHYARRAIPWDTLSSPTQTAALDAWLAGARAAHVNPLLSFTHSSANGASCPPPSACSTSSAACARAIRGDRLRELERGQPLRRADLPSPRARGRLLAQPAPRLPSCRSSPPRSSTCRDDLVGEGVPPRGEGRAALLGAAQLPRRQPAADDRHAAAAEGGQGQGLVHRDGRDRVAHEPPESDLPGVRRARGDGDALPLRRARPAEPPDHARLPLPLEQRPGPQDLGLGAHRPDRQAPAGLPRAPARAHPARPAKFGAP